MYDFGARLLDSRPGRLFSIDPKSGNILLTGLSSRHFGINNPIIATDRNGELLNSFARLIAGRVAAVVKAIVTDKDDPNYWKKVGAAEPVLTKVEQRAVDSAVRQAAKTWNRLVGKVADGMKKKLGFLEKRQTYWLIAARLRK